MVIRVLISALSCVLTVGVSGCQTYQAAPFDSAAFARAWKARSDRWASAHVDVLSTQPSSAIPSISLPEAEAYALVFNPSLRLARQRAGVARVRSDHSGAWEDPSLGINVERILSSSPDRWVLGGTVNLTLPLSGRLEAEKARASAAHHAELIRVAGEEFIVRHRVRTAWAEWTHQSARLSLVNELLTRLDAINRITSRLAESGAITRVESRVFQVERATRQAEQITARSALAGAQLQLLSLLGLTPEARVKFASLPTVSTTSRPRRAFVFNHNFEVRVAAAEYEIAEKAIKHEIQSQYPDLVVGPGFGTDQGDERALLGLSLPLPIWNRNEPAIAAARAERDLARAQLELAIEQSTAAFALAEMYHATASERRSLYESSIVPAADEQADDAQRLAELGEVNAVLLLDAFVRQYEARRALLDAALDESVAASQISQLLGEMPSTQPARKAEGLP